MKKKGGEGGEERERKRRGQGKYKVIDTRAHNATTHMYPSRVSLHLLPVLNVSNLSGWYVLCWPMDHPSVPWCAVDLVPCREKEGEHEQSTYSSPHHQSHVPHYQLLMLPPSFTPQTFHNTFTPTCSSHTHTHRSHN